MYTRFSKSQTENRKKSHNFCFNRRSAELPEACFGGLSGGFSGGFAGVPGNASFGPLPRLVRAEQVAHPAGVFRAHQIF